MWPSESSPFAVVAKATGRDQPASARLDARSQRCSCMLSPPLGLFILHLLSLPVILLAPPLPSLLISLRCLDLLVVLFAHRSSLLFHPPRFSVRAPYHFPYPVSFVSTISLVLHCLDPLPRLCSASRIPFCLVYLCSNHLVPADYALHALLFPRRPVRQDEFEGTWGERDESE
ncbi:hypothetical protein FA13DRAFT_1742560 [Coprinellus micaceus]|uniref:Uncharacterized protein n=1 Tax=Coprinellus micaceus TaxID=71717 RepID=A0A4Y7SGB9_COPMI|nr:hypothetical protein FA13DRAFT_1742560 [Coprinellus micaceus]